MVRPQAGSRQVSVGRPPPLHPHLHRADCGPARWAGLGLIHSLGLSQRPRGDEWDLGQSEPAGGCCGQVAREGVLWIPKGRRAVQGQGQEPRDWATKNHPVRPGESAC